MTRPTKTGEAYQNPRHSLSKMLSRPSPFAELLFAEDAVLIIFKFLDRAGPHALHTDLAARKSFSFSIVALQTLNFISIIPVEQN